MRNLLTTSQIRDADAHTILSRHISSLELMEEASLAFAYEFIKQVPSREIPISIYCGNGNNGGDGLAVARILTNAGYQYIDITIARFSDTSSPDFTTNLERAKLLNIKITELSGSDELQQKHSEIIIDALLGSGLNKPVGGWLRNVIDHINASQKMVISIDVPSGFPSEGTMDPGATIIKSSLAISFQRPKINFFFPESAEALKRFESVPIGLDEQFIEAQPSQWKLIEEQDIKSILNPRSTFSHKGTYGHALIIAGSTEAMGAALLCADACLHAGAGLTSACIPENGLHALNTRLPEIMALVRNKNIPSSMFQKYSAIAIGPGMGTDELALDYFRKALAGNRSSMVIDADALSMLAGTPELFKLLPAMSILTPHMKEFDRMFGEHNSWWERIETARKKTAEFNLIIVLKNQYSFVILPDGNVLINPTGNPAMAVGGMGDVLTGMIVSFLAQRYSAKDAAVLACFLHGKAGDELKEKGMNSIPPRYLIESLPFVLARFA